MMLSGVPSRERCSWARAQEGATGRRPAGRRRTLDGEAFAAGQQAAHFEHDLAAAVVVARQQRVGRFLIVVVGVLAALRERGLGPFGIAQAPPAMPISCTPWLPMSPLPVSQNQCQLYLNRSSLNGPHGRGPQEQIPVHARRRGAVRLVPDRGAPLEAQPLGQVDLADQAAVQGLHGFILNGMLRCCEPICTMRLVSRATCSIFWPS